MLGTWLLAMVRNDAIDHLRRWRAHEPLDADDGHYCVRTRLAEAAKAVLRAQHRELVETFVDSCFRVVSRPDRIAV